MHQTRRPDREPHCSTCKAAFDEFRAHVAARVLDLEARLAHVEAQQPRRRGPRDDLDVALIATIAQAVLHRTFSCGELLAHSRVDGALRRALTNAEVRSEWQLGKFLRRVSNAPAAGAMIARVGRRRWRVLGVTATT